VCRDQQRLPRTSLVLLWAALVLGAGAQAEYSPVRKWAPSGSRAFVWPRGIAVDHDGNVYVADTDNHRIQKFRANGEFLTEWGSGGAEPGQFMRPAGVAVDAAGDVYVADTHNHRIQKFSPDGEFLTGWGAQGSGDGQFERPTGIALDTKGRVYIADMWNDRIQKFTSSGTFIRNWGSRGASKGQFRSPRGVAVDTRGYVYVADTSNNRIQKFTSTGTFLKNWAATGGVDGGLIGPEGVATDAVGYVYVADTNRDRILKFTPAGVLLTTWGAPGSGDAHLCSPQGLAVDDAGRIFIADTGHNRIQVLRPGPGPALSWLGTEGFVSDGVEPDSGYPRHHASRTTFAFRVQYTEPTGEPAATANCLIQRRVGSRWVLHLRHRCQALSGDPMTGQIWEARTALPAQTYRYRYEFNDADRLATTPWKSGPTVSDSASAMLAGLAAVPSAAGAQVTFSLSATANVDAVVLNIAGRPIRTLVADRPLEAGLQTLLWNRQSDAGLAVPDGTYLIRVTARSADGSQSSAIVTLSLR